MTVLLVLAVALGLYATRSFETKLLVALAVLPFVGWLQAHAPSVPWSVAATGLVAVLAFHGLVEPPAEGRWRPAYGLTAVVLAYVAVAAAQAFSPDLPSVTLGLRGLRLVLEPIAFFFVGAEVARRPALLRRAAIVVLVTGAIALAYGVKQWLGGFDPSEVALYRRTFPIAIRERRIFSTLPGASAFGHFAGLVGLVAGVWVLRRPRSWVTASALLAASVLCVFLTGQRGVQMAVIAAAVAVVALAFLRGDFRREGARAAQVLVGLVAVAVALVLATPPTDRREASKESATALDSARVKLALLRQGGGERSAQLRLERGRQARDALTARPLGAGTGLSLMVDPDRSRPTTFLGGAGLGDPTFTPALEPLPGELYYYTLASELGLPGLALFLAIAAYGITTSGGIAMRHPDRDTAALGLVATGYFVIVVVDGLTVDAMLAAPVAAWFWLLLGIVGRRAQQDRALPADTAAAR